MENKSENDSGPELPRNSGASALNNTANDEEEDSELDSLLDSALQDFGPPTQTLNGSSTSAEGQSKPSACSSSLPESEQEKAFAEAFKHSEFESFPHGQAQFADAPAQFEEMLQALMKEEPQMAEQLKNLTEAVGAANTNPSANMDMFQQTLHQTLGGLAQNVEDMHGGIPGEEDLLKMMSGMGLDGKDFEGLSETDESFMPMVQGMMKSLMSKDVLYPSLKEITNKYPAWLSENKGKIDCDEHKKYSKQFELMKQICTEFESEKPSDNEQIKQERFDNILHDMQCMQELGQPPKDIVGEMAPGLEFDANGAPKFPASPDQCCMM